MVSTPKVRNPDGILRETTIFSTTQVSRVFFGVMDLSTVDMRIRVRGGPWTSDPDLIVFEGSSFTVPNPSVYPEGLSLVPGDNLIEIQSVSFSGAVSAPATITVRLVQDSDVGLIGQIPTNIRVERLADSVVLYVEGIKDARLRGFNFYASRFPGGGASGYRRVNLDVVGSFASAWEEQELRSFTADSTLALGPDGNLAADPLFIEMAQSETRGGDTIERLEDVVLTPELAAAITEARQEDLVKTDFITKFEVPETVRSVRTVVRVLAQVEIRTYSFDHDRTAGPASKPATVPIGEFASLANTEPLYYVISALYYDPVDQTEVESAFSVEVVGSPITITQNVGGFPTPTQEAATQLVLDTLLRVEPELSVAPGSGPREIFVDPIAFEVRQVRFLVDFLHRSQSFDTLLAIDGVGTDQTSTPVTQSAYKKQIQQSFRLSRPEDVQVILDALFEQLAARVGVFRLPGQRARALVTFYQNTKPGQSVIIPLGSVVAAGGVTFVTTEDLEVPFSDLPAYYNAQAKRYEFDVSVQAERPGANGNVSVSQITSIVSTLPGLSVTNKARAFGGKNAETNFQLAERARRALASVDVGTIQGHKRIAADVAGLENVVVVEADNSLMLRDYDPQLQRHLGGKTDVYMRGGQTAKVTDRFSFSYDLAYDMQFVPVGNPANYILQSLDSKLSQSNPLVEILNYPNIGLGLRNATLGVEYDLTDIKIIDFRTVQLSTDIPQPALTEGYIILGDYRYVTTREFTFPRQPVLSVVSVVGEASGTLPATDYEIVRNSSPLEDGGSTKAKDELRILTGPTGALIPVVGEPHVLIGEFEEYLGNLGVNPLTIKVYNQARTILYRGPLDPSGVYDYVISPESGTTPVSIRRVSTGLITSGQQLVIDYSHEENFVVEYEANLAVQVLQSALDANRHVSEDVLAKQAPAIPVDVTATIVRTRGLGAASVERAARTNLTTFIRSLDLGAKIASSDIIRVLEETSGVVYVGVPLTTLARSPGSQVLRDTLEVGEPGDALLLLGTLDQPFSSATVSVYLLKQKLSAATTVGGGPLNLFRQVLRGDTELALFPANPAALRLAAGRCYIIGDDGLAIPGYSDDDTLSSQYPTASATELAQKRRDLTADRILISLDPSDNPIGSTFYASYIVSSANKGVSLLQAGELEYFEPGTFILTQVEDQ